MKILMFGWEFPPHIAGGLGVACFGLTRGLHELGGVELTFVVPRAHGDEDERYVSLIGADRAPRPPAAMAGERVEIATFLQPYMSAAAFRAAIDSGTAIALPGLFEEVLDYARRAAALLGAAREYDLIHAHDWMTFPAALAVAQDTNTPLVVHIHSTEFDRSGGNVDLRIVDIERRAMDRADRIVTVSALTRRVLIERYQQPAAKISVVHNAIVPYASMPAAPAPVRAEAPPLVTFIGRVTYQKGPEYFVEAAHLVLQRRSDVRFVLAGDGDLLPFVKELALSLGIGDAFEFPGFLSPDAVRRLHEASAVFVMPSVSEPFGIAALEAIACDVPVIVSDRAGVSEVIESMLVVDPEDVALIAAGILRLLDDTDYADSLRRGARRQLQALSWRSAAERLRGLYSETVAGAAVRARGAARAERSGLPYECPEIANE